MITCFIRYHIDPTKKEQFNQYARNWGQAIPRCGADLIGTTHRMKAHPHWPTVSITSRVWPRTRNIGRVCLPIHWDVRITNLPREKNS